MSCSQDVTMPEDKTAPAEVTNFSVTLENTTASLSWTNPSDDDFAGVQISMTPAEGFLSTPISIGKSSTSFIVTGLKTESTYLFTLKTFDNKLNYSIGSSSLGFSGSSGIIGSFGCSGSLSSELPEELSFFTVF